MDNLLKSIENVRKQRKCVESASVKSRAPIPAVLHKTTYPLNKSQTKFVSVGLRPDSGFWPIVQIYGEKNDWVTFDEPEWKQLIESQIAILNYWSVRDVTFQPLTIYSKSIAFLTIGPNKVIHIRDQCGAEIYLGLESLLELWELVILINLKLELVRGLDFNQFYGSIITGVADLPGEAKSNILTVLAPVIQAQSENAYCMLEMVKFAEEIINADIETEKRMTQLIANNS